MVNTARSTSAARRRIGDRRPVALAAMLWASVGCGASEEASAPAAARTEPVPAAPLNASQLRLLSQVNQPDQSKARPYAERHKIIAQLEGTPDAARIDRRNNLALDLRQAEDTPDPCATYEASLSAIALSRDPYYVAALRETLPPSACDGLAADREAALAALTGPAANDDVRAGPGDADPTPVAAAEDSGSGTAPPVARARPGRPSRRPAAGRRRRPAPVPQPAASTQSAPPDPEPDPEPAVTKKPKPSIDTAPPARLDDDLKPFGK